MDHPVERALAPLVRRPCLTDLGSCRKSAAIIGHNVSAVSAESTTATDTVTPNSRNSRPMMPPMNNSGMKTAINETVIDTIVKPISAEPLSAAVSVSMRSSC